MQYGDTFTLNLASQRMVFLFGHSHIEAFFKAPDSEITFRCDLSHHAACAHVGCLPVWQKSVSGLVVRARVALAVLKPATLFATIPHHAESS